MFDKAPAHLPSARAKGAGCRNACRQGCTGSGLSSPNSSKLCVCCKGGTFQVGQPLAWPACCAHAGSAGSQPYKAGSSSPASLGAHGVIGTQPSTACIGHTHQAHKAGTQDKSGTLLCMACQAGLAAIAPCLVGKAANGSQSIVRWGKTHQNACHSPHTENQKCTVRSAHSTALHSCARPDAHCTK